MIVRLLLSFIFFAATAALVRYDAAERTEWMDAADRWQWSVRFRLGLETPPPYADRIDACIDGYFQSVAEFDPEAEENWRGFLYSCRFDVETSDPAVVEAIEQWLHYRAAKLSGWTRRHSADFSYIYKPSLDCITYTSWERVAYVAPTSLKSQLSPRFSDFYLSASLHWYYRDRERTELDHLHTFSFMASRPELGLPGCMVF